MWMVHVRTYVADVTWFVSEMIDQPLHVREHSKAVLTRAIMCDTHFLSSHLVMDYSLLVGLDENNKELVLGIIGQCWTS